MKGKVKILLAGIATILTFISITVASSASGLWVYQPKTPKALQTKKA